MTVPMKIPVRLSIQWSLAGITAALLAISSWITIPFWPVPITFQPLVLFTAALTLGSQITTLSLLVYWALGILGLPVFAGGMGGIGTFLGPTGGFLLGFLPASLITSYLAYNAPSNHAMHTSRLLMLKVLILGHLILYGIGVLWLGFWLGNNWISALLTGVIVFLPGDSLKILVILIVVPRLNRIFTFAQPADHESS